MENKEYEVKTIEHIVSYDGKDVYGQLYYPDEEGVYGAVILSHGYNGVNTDFVNECKELAKNGYVAYAYDFCGGSMRSKSSLKTTEMTVFTEKADLLAVFDDISNLPMVDSSKVFLFGGSQGGFVSTLATEELQDKVKALVLYYPALNIPDDWRNNFKTEEEIPEEIDFWGMKLGKEFFTSIRDFYTFDNIGTYKGNVIIIYGDKDPIVPSGAMDKAVEAYENIELVVLPGEGHGFSPEGGKTAIEKAIEFIIANS
ncbi:MAG: alpha/beta fold hydrolase [Lachnospiraceae bacterium]|nr:alpha/beta fold hydrolase [Lachnospiraceae bacterium]